MSIEYFECTICGKCCMHMKEVLEVLPQLAKVIGEDNACFPYSHNNGVCEKLSPDNRCMVYEDRPIICNVNKLSRVIAENTGQDFDLIKNDIYKQLKQTCLELKADKFKFGNYDID